MQFDSISILDPNSTNSLLISLSLSLTLEFRE